MFTTRPELAGTFGMVASTHWLASSTGMAVLEDGGNAIDAAVAAAFVLHVVEPHLNGPGGEVPVLFAPAGGPVTVLCGQGVAPAAATIEHYTSLGLDQVPGTGLLAATVPGAVGGWLTLLRDHGTRRIGEVLAYAISYAENGHPITAGVVRTISQVADLLRTHWPSSAAIWLPGGVPPSPGGVIRNLALAETYRRLTDFDGSLSREAECDAAIERWYDGFVAETIDRFARTEVMDSTGTPHAGVLTGADLAGWRPTYEPPATLDWRDWTVCKPGLWSQGPVLLQQLALLDGLLPDRLPLAEDGWPAEIVHVVAECAKLAFADREAWYGDSLSDPAAGPGLAALLDPAYAAARRALVCGQASLQLRPGEPHGVAARLPRLLEPADLVGALAAGQGEPTVARDGMGEPTVDRDGATRGDTCHIDVVDRWGNVVSATPSGGWLQSSPAIPGLGFCLGSRAQMFWLQPDLPASLVPGRRPRTTLSPSLALRDGQPVLSFGTPGGDQQDQWQLGFFLAHVLGGLDLQAAIDAPAWHSTAFPSSFAPRVWEPGGLVAESRLGPQVLAELQQRGHRVTVSDAWSLGRLSAAARDPRTGVLRAAANPRGMQGYAVGR